jgi:hypothetical protein
MTLAMTVEMQLVWLDASKLRAMALSLIAPMQICLLISL